jgi:hypothetical protein
MKITQQQIQKHIEMLNHTPGRITAVISGLDEASLSWSPDRKTWSAVEVLAHLRACLDIWGFSIYAMLAEDIPMLPEIDERRWAVIAGYKKNSFHRSFQVFNSQHAALIEVLGGLAFESWSRESRINGRQHTIFSQVRRIAIHEVVHCVQLEELILHMRRSG